MRTIKFRCWDKETKIIFPVEVWANKSYVVVPFQIDGKEFEPLQIPLDKVDLMQFTGLLDQTRKEIYEGDIVRSANCIDGTGCEYSGIGVVKLSEYGNRGYCLFDNYLTGIENSYPKHVLDMMDFDMSGLYWKLYEVIGNTYENPELIATSGGKE